MEGFTSCWGMTVTKATLEVLTVLQELNVWGRKSPSGVQGQSPGRGPGRSPPEAEAKCEIIVYKFQRFLVENSGFNEYRS